MKWQNDLMLVRRPLTSATNARTLKARTVQLKVLHSAETQCTYFSMRTVIHSVF